MRKPLRILAAVFLPLTVSACMWDAESLSREKSRSHDLAQTIINNLPIPEDTNHLRASIQVLEADRHEDDPMWWNNLAVAHLRLGESAVAVKLLEPIVEKFPDDYGIHANLGTAYHILGRYQDAEKEIARDLEINPHAHFDLEKYHLALLQYLVRNPKYKARHVYIDECTTGFLMALRGGHIVAYGSEAALYNPTDEDYSNNVAAAESDYKSLIKTNQNDSTIAAMLTTVAATDPPPAYLSEWNLLTDTNFEAGVIYMAQMNPKEPACMTMLGIAAWRKRDYHLAAVAFDKAIALGSPQAELLKKRADGLRDFISHSAAFPEFITRVFLFIAALLIVYIWLRIRFSAKRRAHNPA
jgi:tetratricopeptide (TPR) repeat protein